MIIDTDSSCIGKKRFLRSKNVETVGRYYRAATHPEWKLSREEALELSSVDIRLFVIFEDYGSANKLVLTREQGKKDGRSALRQARTINQPEQTAIYFALEGLPSGYKRPDLPQIRDYFSGIQEVAGNTYQLGVYGNGLVCKTMLDEKFCKYAWLAAASTSFEGTVAFMRTWRWSLAQLGPLDIRLKELSIDLNVSNGQYGSFLVT